MCDTGNPNKNNNDNFVVEICVKYICLWEKDYKIIYIYIYIGTFEKIVDLNFIKKYFS